MITAGLPGVGNLDDAPSVSDPQSKGDQNLLSNMMVHRYKCHLCEPSECSETTHQKCRNAMYCFKSSVRESDGALRQSRGCVDVQDHYQFTCRTNQTQGLRKRHAGQLNITCCRGDYCNDGDFPELPPIADTAIEPLSSNIWKLWVTVVVSIVVVTLIGVLAIRVIRRMHRLKVSRLGQKLGADSQFFSHMYSAPVTNTYYDGSGMESGSFAAVKATAAGDSTLREYLSYSDSSGSGSGLPLMVQRTLAKQLTLLDCVGKGRYGEVWRGLWCADTVAVKIFFSRDEASWRRETEVYSTAMLRHANVLAYVGSDMTSRNSCTQLWLITHYHPLGSLYDHLNRTTLTRHQMMVICLSTVSGLLHLHTEIHGTQGKPAIAHRDIKSKNILVKSDGSCCIADLGLAVTKDHVSGVAPLAHNPRQGTKRYMSPELLDETIDVSCLESFRQCDIYALGFVLWEVCMVASGRDYRPPLHHLVPADPSFELMRKLICVDGARPTPPNCKHPTMVGMAKLMRECWHQNYMVRLPALRVKKTLLKLAMADDSIHLDEDTEVSV